MNKKFTLAVMACTALSGMMTAPALAFTDGTATIDDPVSEGPDATTLAAMQARCGQIAAGKGPNTWHGTLGDYEDAGEGEIISGPTVAGARVKGPITGYGGQTPASVQVATDPYRNGGSVNMFALAHVVGATWNDSEYDFTQAFTWVAEYDFTCEMTEDVPHPALGIHVWTGPSQADGGAAACADTVAHPYDDRGEHCEWQQTVPAGVTPTPGADEYDSITQNEGDDLEGHEDHNGPIPVDPNEIDLDPVQVVVCISPTTGTAKRPGAWVAKNGYSGGVMAPSATSGTTPGCNTAWFNGGATLGVTNLNTSGNSMNVTVPYQ
jgi:hypothetical protein